MTKLNLCCLHFISNSIKNDSKLILELSIKHIIESIHIMEEGNDVSEVGKLCKSILDQLK